MVSVSPDVDREGGPHRRLEIGVIARAGGIDHYVEVRGRGGAGTGRPRQGGSQRASRRRSRAPVGR